MAQKTLERLTFDYLQAFDRIIMARQAHETLSIRRNRMVLQEAEMSFEGALKELQFAVSPTTVPQYIQGLRDLANASVEYITPKTKPIKRRRPASAQIMYIVDSPNTQEE